MRLSTCGLLSLLISSLVVSSAFASGHTVIDPNLLYQDRMPLNYTPVPMPNYNNDLLLPRDNFIYSCSNGYVIDTVKGGCKLESSEDSDLDKAMDICRGKRTYTGTYTDNNYYGKYGEEWKNCTKIEDKWSKTVAGVAERKRKEKEQKDLDFINNLAGK